MKANIQPANSQDPIQTIPELPQLGLTTASLREIIPAPAAAKPTRIAFLGCGVKIHFPWNKTCASYDRAFVAAHAALDKESFELIRAPEPFENPDALVRWLDENATDLGGIILFHAAYTAGEIGSYLGRWLTDHPLPLLSWSFPDPHSERLTANSLCCQNFILNMLTRFGVRYTWAHQNIQEGPPPILWAFCRSVRARQRMRYGKLLHVGGTRVTAFYDGETDELAVMRRFGLRFDRVDLEAVFQHARTFSDAAVKRLADSLVNSPWCARREVPDVQIFQTLRLGLAIMDLSVKHNYIGCTIKSWPELFDQYGCAADGAVSMLNDAGLCTAEEGDMHGLISSLAMYLLSDGRTIPTMMDITGVDSATNRIALWHCGASPTRLLKPGTKFEARRHSILENADTQTAVGLMVEFLLKTGPSTVVRYQSPTAGRCFAFEGEMMDCQMPFRGVYGEMQPTAPWTATDIIGTIIGKGLDHHWSLGFGHWKPSIRLLNHWLGVEELTPEHLVELSGLSQSV